RVRSRALQEGMSEADADALAALCSGDSLRAGYCTAEAMASVAVRKIRNRSPAQHGRAGSPLRARCGGLVRQRSEGGGVLICVRSHQVEAACGCRLLLHL